MRKLRVGLVGVMTTPFKGDKESRYAETIQQLAGLAEQWGFDLRPVLQGIYSSEDAGHAVKALREQEIDFLLIQTSSFTDGSHIKALVDAAPYIGLWAMPEGSNKSGPLPFNSFCAMNMFGSIIKNYLKARDIQFKWFYGRVGEELFAQRFHITLRALTAVINLKQAKVALVGGIAPGFDNLYYDERRIEAKTGVQVVRHLEFLDIKNRAEKYSNTELKSVLTELRCQAASIQEGMEPALMTSARIYKALKDIALEEDIHALALSCWPKFQTEMQFAVCSVIGSLNAAGLPTACEGDVYSAVSMLALKTLTGQTTALMDLVDFDFSDQSALLWHCGPAPHSLADEKGMALEGLYLMDKILPDGSIERTGLMGDLVLKPGQATVAAFTNDFDRYLVLEGELDNRKPSYKGARGWYKNIRLYGEDINLKDFINTIMVSGFQHHYPLVYGPAADEWIEMCQWLGMQPVKKVSYKPYLQR